MRLRPETSVTDASAPGEIKRTSAAGASGGRNGGAPEDAIRVSRGFGSLATLSVDQITKVASLAAAVQGGTYAVDSAAVGKAIIEDALS